MKKKSIGKIYTIAFENNWEHVADTANALKKTLLDTSNAPSRDVLFNIETQQVEKELLKAYLVPKEDENFTDYRKRFIQTFLGSGLKAKLASLICRDKIPLDYRLDYNDGESTFRVISLVKEEKYETTISASGKYSERAAKITSDIKELLDTNSIPYTYKTIDKII